MGDEPAIAGLLRITPAGHLLPASDSDHAGLAPGLQRVLEAFREDPARGLFELAARPISGGLPPELAYWRDFAARYLGALCHTPTGTSLSEPVVPPGLDELTSYVLSVPPMPGVEYLSADVLVGMWSSVDDWVRGQVADAGGLEAFLAAQAPLWRQVGRVCFHLAENKKDTEYPFAFLATYAPRLTESARVRYQPLGRALQELAGERNRRALVHLLTPVQRAAEKSNLIRALVDSSDIYQPLAWTPQEAYSFLKDTPLYEEAGVLVRVPDWWTRRSRPQVAVKIGSQAGSMLGADSLLDFTVETVVGDAALSEAEVRKLLAGADGLVFLKGRWVEIDRARLKEALEHWKRMERRVEQGGISFAEGMRLLAGAPPDLEDSADAPAAGLSGPTTGWSSVEAGPWLRDVLARLRVPQADGDLPRSGLHATLRPYQEAGVGWLRLLSGLGLGACLADDMGLGKTMQVLALLLLLRKEKAGSSLLVLPASLLANWKSEIDRFAPSIRAAYLHPSMQAPDIEAADLIPRVGDFDLVVTSYGMLSRLPDLAGVAWNLVVLDEAQAIKNPGTRQTRLVKRLRARARIALTGTPVENRLSDLWSLFDFLCPGLLGSQARFKGFVETLEKRQGERYAPLRSLVRPYILRRLKTDRTVIADLPDKTVVSAWCGLTRAQAALYQSSGQRACQGHRHSGRDEAARAHPLHPAQAETGLQPPSSASGRWTMGPRGQRQVPPASGAGGGDRLSTGPGPRLHAVSGNDGAAGLVPRVRFRPAGLVLHGQTPVKERQNLVQAFQAENGPPFFVLSLKAGGTGLNLTAATHVIHFDRWWNPAVENQATDRAFRIGQKRNVLVHTFVCRGTVEEKIDALIQEKTALARDLLEASGEALLTEMTDDELLSTVALDIGRARSE